MKQTSKGLMEPCGGTNANNRIFSHVTLACYEKLFNVKTKSEIKIRKHKRLKHENLLNIQLYIPSRARYISTPMCRVNRTPEKSLCKIYDEYSGDG